MTTKAGQQPKGKGDENQEEVERQDAQETSEDTTAEAQEQNAQRNDGEDGTQEDTEKVFTRTDAEKIAASAVNSYIESQKATRSDGGGLDADTLAAAFAKANEPLVQRIDALTSKVQEIESEAVSRDDSDDETAGGGEQQGMTEEVKRKDPFRGSILPGLASVYPSNRRRA